MDQSDLLFLVLIGIGLTSLVVILVQWLRSRGGRGGGGRGDGGGAWYEGPWDEDDRPRGPRA